MIMVYKMNWELLKIRNLGPSFLVYPMDAAELELNSPAIKLTVYLAGR
jgi:hypothetical protein